MIFFNQTGKYTEIAPGLVVHAYNILTTREWIAVLLQHTPSHFGPFSSLCSIHPETHDAEEVTIHGVYGHWESANIPLDIDALPPMSPERYAAFDEWRGAREEEAYAAIIATYPEFAEGKRSMGHISITMEPDHCSCQDEQIIPQPCPLHG